MPAMGAQGTIPSAFAPVNALYDPTKIQQQTMNEQTIAGNEMEMMARASSGLLDPKLYPDEASRAAAYPGVVANLRQYGFAKNAPDAYPGEATLRRVALMGTPSSKLAEWNYNTGANTASLGGTPGTTQPATTSMPSVTTTQPGAGGGGGSGSEIYSLPKAEFLAAVAKRESGGDPTALNYVAKADPTAYARGATASGKYQMVNSTWLTAAKAAGVDTNKYPTARDAPEAVQDQVASALYDMQGTAPWNPATFGRNWVKGEGGKYTLQAGGGEGGSTRTPPAPVVTTTEPETGLPVVAAAPAAGGGVAKRTGGVDVAGPPMAPPGSTGVAAALPHAQASAEATRSGQPVPIANPDGSNSGLVALPNGGVRNAAVPQPPANGLAPGQPGNPPAPTQQQVQVQQPRLPQQEQLVDNLTAANRRDLTSLLQKDPAVFQQRKAEMQAQNIAQQHQAFEERRQAAADQAAQAERDYTHGRNTVADVQAAQRRVEEARAAEDTHAKAVREADAAAKAAGQPYMGNERWAQFNNDLRTKPTDSQDYAIAYSALAAPTVNPDGSKVYPSMAAFAKPTYKPPGATEVPDYSQPTVTPPTTLNATQGKAANFADRMAAANPIMNDLDTKALTWSQRAKDKVGNFVGYNINSPDYQRLRTAQEAFIVAVTRDESGAAVHPDEFDKYAKIYFPQPGEDVQTIKLKQRLRQIELEGLAREAGPGYRLPETKAEANPAPVSKEIIYDHSGNRVTK